MKRPGFESSMKQPSRPTQEDARKILSQVFGFQKYQEGQEKVITRLLDGKSVLAIFPTGGGKSLCYQLPALLLDGLTLVISPLIALMKDQIDFLLTRNVPAARLDSSLEREEALKVFGDLNSGRLKLLYISPERLGNERFIHSLCRRSISLLAIDEAHCISEWGHNFRPDYLKIARLARQLKVGRVLALTATATPEVARDIAKSFGIAENDVIKTGFYRPNLKMYITPTSVEERKNLLLARLRERSTGPAIIYVTRRRTAEETADFLSKNGFEAKPYHAGMEKEDRNAVQDVFMASNHSIVVATIAFGMGVDKADIRYVYHSNLPKGLEHYMQEIGRAGRDGRESICELFACVDDVVTLENFSYGDTPQRDAIASLLTDVLGRGKEFDVSIYDLSYKHDIRPLVVKTLLAYLELENVIQSTGSFYSAFKYQMEKEEEKILARFDRGRAEFLKTIFRKARKGKIWFTVDIEEVSREICESRERIVAALTYLDEIGDLLVKASGARQGYRLIKKQPDFKGLCEKLNRRFARREKQDIARIHSMLLFAEHDGCLTKHLLAYFGETRGDCCHCGWCEGIRGRPISPARYTSLGEADAKKLQSLRAEEHQALGAPRQLTRFLCGISSPATSRARLKSHSMFGAFDSIPFHKVLAFVEK